MVTSNGGKVVYIFGAGASYESGWPLGSGYFEKLIGDFHRNDVPSFSPGPGKTQERIAIEKLAADLELFFDSKPTYRKKTPEEAVKAFFSDLDERPEFYSDNIFGYCKRTIYSELMALVLFYPDDFSKSNIYMEFLKKVDDANVDFISFNQDTMLDIALLCDSYPWNYGIDISIRKRSGVELSSFKQLTIKQGRKLIKFNGSISWLVCPNCHKVYTFPERVFEYSAFPRTDKFFHHKRSLWEVFTSWFTRSSFGAECPFCYRPDSEGKLHTVLTYKIFHPYLIDYASFLKPHTQRLSGLTTGLLSNARRIISVGYSFPDSDEVFLSVLKMAIADNPYEPEIMIVSESPSAASGNADNLARTLEYSKVTAGQYTGFGDYIKRLGR